MRRYTDMDTDTKASTLGLSTDSRVARLRFFLRATKMATAPLSPMRLSLSLAGNAVCLPVKGIKLSSPY